MVIVTCSVPTGDDTLLPAERAALHSPEMGSPPGLRYGLRDGDSQTLPVRNVHKLVQSLCFPPKRLELLTGITREPFGRIFFTMFHDFFVPGQGVEDVPVAYGSADPLHDQLSCSAFVGSHIACSPLVSGGMDLGCVPESRCPPWLSGRWSNARGSAIQHVQARPLGLHDGGW